MKESKLTPFDAETILMIKSVTGHERRFVPYRSIVWL